MAHKIDFKTFKGSYGVYVTPKEYNSIIKKLIELKFNYHNHGNKSLWIYPKYNEFYSWNISQDLAYTELVTAKQLTTYLNKLLKIKN